MSRRFRFFSILFIAAVGTCLAAFGGWRYARASAPVNGPIVLISIDALRADRLSLYGYKDTRTPAIDELAADGIVFERAYTHAAETLPAHVSMLSGRLPFETGVRGDDGHVNKAERLLGRLLRERGYATAGIVSSASLARDTGIADGFDFFDAPPAPESGPGPLPARRAGVESEKIAEHWLDLQSSRAFLFLHLDDVHQPYPPAEDADGSQRYDAQVAQADEAIGRLVRWLKAHQLYDTTTILLTADHGEGLGEHGEQEHGVFAYDETIHVPLIVKLAGTITGGRRVGAPVQIIDVTPTVLDLVKAPIAGNLRGRSLKPVLDGGALEAPKAIYAEARYGRRMFGWSPIATITDGTFRYIAAPREELYDLAADPREQRNILDGHAAQAAPLREGLKALTAGVKGADPLHPDAEAADPKDVWPVAERFRANLALRGQGRALQALAGFRAMTTEQPDLSAAWRQIAELSAGAGRYTDAAGAYARVTELEPEDPLAHAGAASVALENHDVATARDEAERALATAKDRTRVRVAAELLLAEASLEDGDADAARAHAAAAKKLDPTAPIASYVDGRLLYAAGDYEAAAEAFGRATAAARTSETRIRDLHYYAGDTLMRLDRADEAEAELSEELRGFPQNTRARIALASLYHTSGRAEEAAAALAETLLRAPAPDTYAQVAKAWASFGNRRQAEAVRADARRAFPPEKRATR